MGFYTSDRGAIYDVPLASAPDIEWSVLMLNDLVQPPKVTEATLIEDYYSEEA